MEHVFSTVSELMSCDGAVPFPMLGCFREYSDFLCHFRGGGSETTGQMRKIGNLPCMTDLGCMSLCVFFLYQKGFIDYLS